MKIDSTLGKYVLLILILGGFIYPTAAEVIKADSEPIGPNAIVPVVAFADTALIAAPKAPKAKVTVATASTAIIATTAGSAVRKATVTFSDAPAKASRLVHITAYSSTPEETDDTPFTTAMGTTVRDGIIATNILPFGTKVRIPALFGQKVFVVEDRMHPRMVNAVDIWMPSKTAALKFGVANSEIEILN